MEADRWRRVRECFERVLERPAAQRADALEEASGGDAWLRDEVASLLRAVEETLGLSRVVPAALAAEAPRLADPAELVGRDVGGFRLRRVIGSGGMGVVFEAEQESPSRRVAVKLMTRGLASERARRRFEYEGEILGRLRHPNVAQVFATGTYAGERDGRRVALPWIAMELVEGAVPLDEHARAAGPDLEAKLRLFRRLCDAVQHAHGRGVVHRDLKPHNALVAGDGTLKVIDFGIARAVDLAGDSQLTQEGDVIGTARYMAPEQLRGEEVDTRCDVYALGIILHELVCEAPAHDLAGKPAPVAYRLLAESAPPAPSTLRAELPRDLDWIVGRALERERDGRYASAAALADDVGRLLRHEPVLARRGGALYRARKFARRHRRGVAALAALVLLGLATLVVYVVGAARVSREHARVLRLADARTIANLRAEAEELYPAHPELAGPMRAWLARAEGFDDRLERHREDLERIEARALATPEETGDGWRFADLQDEWWHAALADLIADVRAFYGEDGAVADVRRRLAAAESIAERTVTGEAARERWRAARASIAELDECPLYGGLELEPQLGLLPLGRDPGSGLWEFLVPATGAEPPRDAAGRLRPSPEAGIVLVLIPGGDLVRFDWSGESPRPGEHVESRSGVERIEPFFLGKWEVTQAQWRRIAGAAPSLFPGPTRPVETVSGRDAARWMRRSGLALPDPTAWEHAMRAGHEGGWWFEAPPGDPAASFAIARAEHVPVGGFPPNPFGLHDLLGNVQEWNAAAVDERQRGYAFGGYHLEPADFASYTRGSLRIVADASEAYPYRGLRAARAVR